MSETQTGVLAPIVKKVHAPLPVDAAFARFTDSIATWWPIATHSEGQEKVETVILEGRVGGRLYERWNDGTRRDWGTVILWQPPDRLAFTWHPGRDPGAAQAVEVVFRASAEGTEVELTHRGWDLLGDQAEEMRSNYDSGWEGVLALYLAV